MTTPILLHQQHERSWLVYASLNGPILATIVHGSRGPGCLIKRTWPDQDRVRAEKFFENADALHAWLDTFEGNAWVSEHAHIQSLLQRKRAARFPERRA